MSEEEKQATEILKNFKNNKLERDKLEVNLKGGFKIGDIYKFTELDPAIEITLNYISKLQKVINLMAKDIAETSEPKCSEEAITSFYFSFSEGKNE